MDATKNQIDQLGRMMTIGAEVIEGTSTAEPCIWLVTRAYGGMQNKEIIGAFLHEEAARTYAAGQIGVCTLIGLESYPIKDWEARD